MKQNDTMKHAMVLTAVAVENCMNKVTYLEKRHNADSVDGKRLLERELVENQAKFEASKWELERKMKAKLPWMSSKLEGQGLGWASAPLQWL